MVIFPTAATATVTAAITVTVSAAATAPTATVTAAITVTAAATAGCVGRSRSTGGLVPVAHQLGYLPVFLCLLYC